MLVFDEPTAGLDPRGRRELMGVMASRPETLLVSTHDLAMVAEALPRMVIIDEGVVVADGAVGAYCWTTRRCWRHTGSSDPAASAGATASVGALEVPPCSVLRPRAAELDAIDLPAEQVGHEDAPRGVLAERGDALARWSSTA